MIGAGAWGTAIAHTMAASGHSVKLWGRSETTIAEINDKRTNARYLGTTPLDQNFQATTDIKQVVVGAEYLFLVTPAQTALDTANAVKAAGLNDSAAVICCSKGLDKKSGKRVSETVTNVCSENAVMVLSGPSFAHDVASGLPTAVTLAGENIDTALDACENLSSKTLRLYASDDIVGVELGGALKNVFAIAAGIVDGARLGASAKAALIARGFAELSRIADAAGGKRETLNGLSGLGDLILTCGSMQSRNYAFGFAMADKTKGAPSKLAEGFYTAQSAVALADGLGVEVPIMRAVSAVISGQISIADAIAELTSRPVKAELD